MLELDSKFESFTSYLKLENQQQMTLLTYLSSTPRISVAIIGSVERTCRGDRGKSAGRFLELTPAQPLCREVGGVREGVQQPRAPYLLADSIAQQNLVLTSFVKGRYFTEPSTPVPLNPRG